ncbi:hypothetical protein ABS71_10525 [bacterium SCN 62-11]|nr:MAG: hypothetical protein ABS71_10525 [bacterium SCN 62-11]
MLVFPEAAPLANAKETVDNLLSQMPVPEKKVHDLSADLLLGSTNLSLPEGVSMGQGGRLLMTDFGPGTGKLPQAKVLLGDLGSSGLASGGILGSYSGARSYAVSGDVQTPFFFSDQKV